MTRVLPALLAVILFAACERDPKQNTPPPPDTETTSSASRSGARVVGYRFRLPGDDHPDGVMPSGFSLIQSDGTVNFDQLDELKETEATLSITQIDTLVAAVYGADAKKTPAACYDPHHIFLFYDDAGEVTKVVEICFSCTNIRTLPELLEAQWYRHDFRALARLCDEIGIGLGTRTAEQFIEILDEKE